MASIQGGLAAKSGEECVWLLLGDDLFDDLGSDRFDVGAISEFGIGHDRGGVAVDQNDLIALFPEGFAGLDAGVVKLAGLTDDDGARSDDENGF